MELNDYYHERGIVKYNGFYLSDHTSQMTKEENERNRVILGEEEMEEREIFETIDYALYKSLPVSIQLNLKDLEGNFLPNVSGELKGYNEASLYIDDYKMPLCQIRHIVLLERTKWYK